jgi:hypothetical protein
MMPRLPRLAARSLRRALVLAPCAGLALFGCATIIGLDEYTVANHAGAAGLSGAAAGAAGLSGGAAGVGVGLAGSDGALGGAAGARGAVQGVGCDGTEFQPNEDIVRSCLLRAGCDPTFNPVRTISTCVTYDTQAALPGESCNLHAQTCADFEGCEHLGVAHADLCGGTPDTGTRCQGGKAINCGNYLGDDRFFDCPALGGTCGTLTDSNGLLYADCKLDIAPDSCTGQPNSGASYFCHSHAGQDDLRYYCWGGAAYGASCSSLATCVNNPPSAGGGEAGAGGAAPVLGNATCYFKTEQCSAPATPTCANDVATVCADGALFKYDCGAVGLSCAIDAGSEYCFAPGCKSADVDTNCQETCSADHSSLTFCYGGAPYTVKCSDYGFNGCLSDTGSDGTVFAACRF